MDWLWNHPAEAAWIAFAALTAFVGAFTAAESKLEAFVTASKGEADNRIFKVVAAIVHVLAFVLRLLKYAVPGIAGGRLARLAPSIPPPAAPSLDVTPVTSPQTPSAISDRPKKTPQV